MRLLNTVLALIFFAAQQADTAWADTITHGSTTVHMEFVTVGNPGNSSDSETGYGAVGYSYRIGNYEVTKNQWDAVVNASGSDLLNDPGEWSGNQPAAGMSWHEAAMFTNWLTSGDVTQGVYTFNGAGEVTGIDRVAAAATYGMVYSLPTEDEWYKAAFYDPEKPGGAGYWDYPTMQDAPTVPDGIDFAGDPDFDAVFLDGYNQNGPNEVTDAGALSAYGTKGQGGNVWEWNETAIGSARGQRGGVWNLDSHFLLASTRDANFPIYEDVHIGFRVASSVPEPGSVAMLAGLVLMGPACWWHRRARAVAGATNAHVGRTGR